MKTSRLSVAALGAAIVGLAASIASAIDDLGAAPAFCAESGCEIVRHSAWARPLGIPMAVLGLVFFASAIALAFAPRLSRLRVVLAIAGGAWAVFLICLQAFSIGAWCKLCLVADPSAIVYALLVIVGAPPLRFTAARGAAMVPALVAIAAVLALWTRAPAPVQPTSTPVELATSTQGDVVVVEYVDFECPFCREMQGRLEEAIPKAKRPVKIVRKMVPLESHRGALYAALAWCVADAHGKGDEMARALFHADPESLTPSGCEALAANLGIDLATFRAGLPAAEQRIRADLEEATRMKIEALPTLFIGTQRFVGASATSADLLAALDRAGT